MNMSRSERGAVYESLEFTPSEEEEAEAELLVKRYFEREKKASEARKAARRLNFSKCCFINFHTGKRTCERRAFSNGYCKDHARYRSLQGLSGDARKNKQAEMREEKLERIRGWEKGKPEVAKRVDRIPVTIDLTLTEHLAEDVEGPDDGVLIDQPLSAEDELLEIEPELEMDLEMDLEMEEEDRPGMRSESPVFFDGVECASEAERIPFGVETLVPKASAFESNPDDVEEIDVSDEPVYVYASPPTPRQPVNVRQSPLESFHQNERTGVARIRHRTYNGKRYVFIDRPRGIIWSWTFQDYRHIIVRGRYYDWVKRTTRRRGFYRINSKR